MLNWNVGQAKILLHTLDKNMVQTLQCLHEVAAAFVYKGMSVPQQVGQLLGLEEQRRREYHKLKELLESPCGQSEANKDVFTKYVKDLQGYSAKIEALLDEMKKEWT